VGGYAAPTTRERLEGEIQDESCGVFRRLEDALDRDALHRFVVGEDVRPRALTGAELAQDLGDPLATLLFRNGVFPRTPTELLEALDAATGADDPLRQQLSFVVGERSQLPFRPENAAMPRILRFVIARGSSEDGPDVMLSVSFPDQTRSIEAMAWDRAVGGFNFYTTVGDDGAWVFAGSSRHALADPTDGKGPFESHRSGSFIMKELRSPWINWHSPDANILPGTFAPDDERRSHPWFTERDPLGAATCEAAVARPAIARWAKARFAAALAPDGTFASPRRVMRQLLGTPSANLVTSHVESRKAARDESFDLPQTFFVDSEALTEILGLLPPPTFDARGKHYARALEKFETRMDDGDGFVQAGDTHFAFLVPERAFEDLAVLRQALDVGLLTERLAATLLMTDFPNPIFSRRREALLAYVPPTATIVGGTRTFSQELADAILAAAEASPADSPEREFAELWRLGDDVVVPFSALLKNYYEAVTDRLTTQEGFDAYYRLAESRRAEAMTIPVFSEFALLFARTNIPAATRTMRRDGTVVES
jgi:hypothetical protein